MMEGLKPVAIRMFRKYLACSAEQAERFYRLCADRSEKNRTPLFYEVQGILDSYRACAALS